MSWVKTAFNQKKHTELGKYGNIKIFMKKQYL